jgi:hypothetical protein
MILSRLEHQPHVATGPCAPISGNLHWIYTNGTQQSHYMKSTSSTHPEKSRLKTAPNPEGHTLALENGTLRRLLQVAQQLGSLPKCCKLQITCLALLRPFSDYGWVLLLLFSDYATLYRLHLEHTSPLEANNLLEIEHA